jgi:hypothetical protein
VADCCLFLKLKLSPTPGLSIDCLVDSLDSSVASPLQAATKRFFLFLVVACCLSNSSVASPLRAATKRFFPFPCCCGSWVQCWKKLIQGAGVLTISIRSPEYPGLVESEECASWSILHWISVED